MSQSEAAPAQNLSMLEKRRIEAAILGEIGHLLSCQRDGSFCGGYDPKLKFARTQTRMQGANHCDFHYVYDTGADGASD